MEERWEKSVRITQGPTVIEETGTEATLTWVTERPSVGYVRYRAADGPWRSVYEQGGATNHALRLVGLQPGREVEWEILARDGDVRNSGRFRARHQDFDDAPPPRRGGYAPHVPMYRADNPTSGQHLYTVDRREIARVERDGWRSVGQVGFVAPTPKFGHIPVFRLYVPNGDHFYTTSMEERDTLLNQGASDEGVFGYIASSPKPGTLALHRMVSTKTGMHFYSANAQEVAEATRHQGYRDEGVMGYVWLQ